MRRFLINFRKSARDRAGEISKRAYNHIRRYSEILGKNHIINNYLRIKPVIGKIYTPIAQIRDSYVQKFGQIKTKKKHGKS